MLWEDKIIKQEKNEVIIQDNKNATSDIMLEEIKKYKKLLDSGIINQEEFNRKLICKLGMNRQNIDQQ